MVFAAKCEQAAEVNEDAGAGETGTSDSSCVGLAVALVGGGILLSFYRDTALSFFGVTVRVLDLLGIGLTSAAGVLMNLYQRLRYAGPSGLPSRGIWTRNFFPG